MNLFKALRRRIVAALFWAAFLFPSAVSAQEQAAEQQPFRLRVIESQEVDLGPRSIFYNRVETPILKPQPAPAPAKQPQKEVAPSAEELAPIREWEAKEDVLLFLTCTVFDRKVTEVRWWWEDGEYVIWSGIDFNYLRNMWDLETDTTRYSIFIGIGDK